MVPTSCDAAKRIRWRVLELTPKTPGPVASADLLCLRQRRHPSRRSSPCEGREWWSLGTACKRLDKVRLEISHYFRWCGTRTASLHLLGHGRPHTEPGAASCRRMTGRFVSNKPVTMAARLSPSAFESLSATTVGKKNLSRWLRRLRRSH